MTTILTALRADQSQKKVLHCVAEKKHTACLRKSHPDEGQVPQQRRKMRRPHLTTVVCLDVIRLSFFELGAGPAARRKMESHAMVAETEKE